jgi:hypothetical protein
MHQRLLLEKAKRDWYSSLWLQVPSPMAYSKKPPEQSSSVLSPQ